MKSNLVKCWDCQRTFYQNELREIPEIITVKKRVCRGCADGKQTMGDIIANKKASAKATAWQSGMGWVK